MSQLGLVHEGTCSCGQPGPVVLAITKDNLWCAKCLGDVTFATSQGVKWPIEIFASQYQLAVKEELAKVCSQSAQAIAGLIGEGGTVKVISNSEGYRRLELTKAGK